MALWGTIVNAVLILLGGIIGFYAKKGIPKKYEEMIMNGMGLVTIVMGIDYALKTQNYLWVILSLVLGIILGEWIDIDKKLEGCSHLVQKKTKSNDHKFVEGMMTATLLFCVGSMAIMGSLDSGIKGDHTILYTKAIMDGISAILLTSSIGVGVIFSVIPLVIYQGSIALSGSLLAPYLNDRLITEVSAVGGVLLVGVGLSILGIKKIKVANMLPAMLIMAFSCLF